MSKETANVQKQNLNASIYKKKDTFLIISVKIIQEFYENFRKRKPTHTSTEFDVFRKHFENLSTFTTNTDNNPPVDTGTTVIEELHIEVSKKKYLMLKIDNLKRDNGIDCIVNEYFF